MMRLARYSLLAAVASLSLASSCSDNQTTRTTTGTARSPLVSPAPDGGPSSASPIPWTARAKLPPITVHFKYSGAVATRRFGPNGAVWTDAQGRRVDPEQLRVDDIHAFENKTDRVDPALDLETRQAGTVLADVWYGVRIPPMAPGERDSAWRKRRFDVIENALRGRAQPLAAQIRAAGGQVLDADTKAPRLRVKASRAALHAIGHLPFVVRLDPVGNERPAPACGTSQASDATENYPWTTGAAQNILDGVTGVGATVVTLEAGCPDSWLNIHHEDYAGGCYDGLGKGPFLCSSSTICCDPSDPSCTPDISWHRRMTASSVQNSVTRFGGSAPGARVLHAMTYTDGVDWAYYDAGADIISVSTTGGSRPANSDQTTADVQLDFAAYSYGILPVAAAGNHGQCITNTQFPSGDGVTNGLRNGLVVGASNSALPRSDVTYPPGTGGTSGHSCSANPGGADGWELPHVVAPGTNSIVAGIDQGALESTSGCTSFATPEVAGIAAEAIQNNSSLHGQPAALMAGMIVAADEKIDQPAGGQWLDLSDGHDDYDGAGLVDAVLTKKVLDPSNRDATPTSSYAPAIGHDFGSLASPQVGVTYYVTISLGETLRAASVMLSKPGGNCNIYGQNCSYSNNPYPTHALRLYDPQQAAYVATSENLNDNYQYLTYHYNGTDPEQEFYLEMDVDSYNGVPSAKFGIAWTSDTWQEPDARFGPAHWWSWPANDSQSTASDFGNNDLQTDESQWGSVTFGDLDGDGLDDVCARNDGGLFCALNWQYGAFGDTPPNEPQPRAFTQKQTFPSMMGSGWGTPDHGATVRLANIEDGKADICGRDSTGIKCAHSTSASGLVSFDTFSLRTSGVDFSDSDTRADFQTDPTAYLTIAFADVDQANGPDACARFHAGVYCAHNNGSGAFAALPSTMSNTVFSDADGSNTNGQGWDVEEYGDTIRFGDINDDGKADACGRGHYGIYCALSNGSGFGSLTRWSSYEPQYGNYDFDDNQGWGGSPAYYKSLRLVDVNDDGKADICGRGSAGIWCALSNGVNGFSRMVLVYKYDFTNAYGWGQEKYGDTIRFPHLGDDNVSALRPASTAYPAVCGRASYGLRCALNREYN